MYMNMYLYTNMYVLHCMWVKVNVYMLQYTVYTLLYVFRVYNVFFAVHVHVHAHVHCAVSYIVHCKRIYSYPLPQVPYLLDVLLAHLAVFPEGTCMHMYFYMSEMLITYVLHVHVL